jgi:type I restriction enzyme M protein
VVTDLACGSGGMFVQSSHFIEQSGQDTMKRVTFYGQEKTATTIRLAKMNLAVHGLEGDIREANSFYDDVHRLQDGRALWGNAISSWPTRRSTSTWSMPSASRTTAACPSACPA